MSLREPGAAELFDRLREFSGFEEELALASGGAPQHAATVANEALARCLVEPGEDPGAWRERVAELALIERDRLLLELRRRSVGDEVRSRAGCPRCNASWQVRFRISELPIETRTAGAVSGVLPNGKTFRLRPLTAGDQAALLEAGGRCDRLSATLARSLVEFGGRPGPFDEEEIAGWEGRDRDAFGEKLDEANPDLDIRLRLTCESCGSEIEAPFDPESFFLPS